MKTQQVDFASLYFGTPVAIISSQNPVGSTNLSPISGNDSNLLIVFYVQIMPDDFVMQLHRF